MHSNSGKSNNKYNFAAPKVWKQKNKQGGIFWVMVINDYNNPEKKEITLHVCSYIVIYDCCLKFSPKILHRNSHNLWWIKNDPGELFKYIIQIHYYIASHTTRTKRWFCYVSFPNLSLNCSKIHVLKVHLSFFL